MKLSDELHKHIQNDNPDAGVADMHPLVLEMHNIVAGYRRGHKRLPVLSGVNISLPPSRVAVMVGRNGSGKSTLLRTIAGVQPPLGGTVNICGHDIRRMNVRETARHIAMVFSGNTEATGAGALTVAEVVALGRHPHTGITGRLHANDRQIIAEALDAVSMADKSDVPLADLSDGLRQKAMIARALAQQTPLIIMDEPTAFLDVPSRLSLMALATSLAHQGGRTILLSTHDIAPAMAAGADSIIIVDNATATQYDAYTPAAIQALQGLYRQDGITYDNDAGDFRVTKQADSEI